MSYAYLLALLSGQLLFCAELAAEKSQRVLFWLLPRHAQGKARDFWLVEVLRI
jgi:hypothetical protein